MAEVNMYSYVLLTMNKNTSNCYLRFFHCSFKLRNNVHVLSNCTAPVGEKDKLWKLKPILEAVRHHRCNKAILEEHLNIDKQMTPFTARLPAKKFIKGKPNPVDLKNQTNTSH